MGANRSNSFDEYSVLSLAFQSKTEQNDKDTKENNGVPELSEHVNQDRPSHSPEWCEMIDQIPPAAGNDGKQTDQVQRGGDLG